MFEMYICLSLLLLFIKFSISDPSDILVLWILVGCI